MDKTVPHYLFRLTSVLWVIGALAMSLPVDASPNQASDFAGRPIVKIKVKGNVRVEEAAIVASLTSQRGRPVNLDRIAVDVRAIWSMNYFEDVKVDAKRVLNGVILTYIVKEKPAVRKIIVGGNDEVDLDKINDVLDLQRNAILDVSKIKRNVVKIRDLYAEKGFYLAEIDYRVRKVDNNRVDIIFTIIENAKVVIRRINFIGNRYVSSDDIRAIMGTQEGGYFSFITSSGTYQETAFQRDLVLISALYYDRGFVNVRVGEPQILLSPDKRFIYINVPIEEGKRYKIGKLDVKGDLLWSKKTLFGDLATKSGEYFSRSKLGKDILQLTNRYKDKGYAYVNVSPLTNVDAKRRTVDLTLQIEKGPVVMFERINVTGNSKTRDKVIRREMKVAEGDRYSESKLERSKVLVNALGFFEQVNISTARGSKDDRIVVNVEVKERPTGTFQIGAGFSSVENFIAQAQVSQNNLFGRGQRLSLQAQISGLRQLFSLSFWEPYFLDSRWTFAFEVFNRLQVIDFFNRRSVGGNLTWGYPITDDIRLFATYNAEMVNVNTSSRGTLFGANLITQLPEGVRIANLFNDGFTSNVRFSVQWDTRNNRLFPTNGFFHAAWAEFATRYLGSQNEFNRYGAFTRWYYPLIGPFVLRVNGQIGLITSPSASGVPNFERYRVGGIFDVRGFRPRTLGPRLQVPARADPNAGLISVNKGGNKELKFNVEIEFPIFEKVGIRGVVFTDAGMAFDDNENISITGLRHSWGFGFRWFSPIGPLRFEWGLPFNPRPEEDSIVFEFTIGNFF